MRLTFNALVHAKIYEAQKEIEKEATAVKSELAGLQQNVSVLASLVRQVGGPALHVAGSKLYTHCHPQSWQLDEVTTPRMHTRRLIK